MPKVMIGSSAAAQGLRIFTRAWLPLISSSYANPDPFLAAPRPIARPER